MKTLTIALIAGAISGAGIAAAMSAASASAELAAVPAPATPAAGTDDIPLFYGALEQSYAWTQEQKRGIYSFTTAPGSDDLIARSPVQNESFVTGGGAYVDGYFYYINGTSTYINISNTFNKMDVSDWKVVSTSGHTSPTKTDAIAMAYDYATAAMYAIATDYDSNGDCVLRRVDLNSGEFTDIAPVKGYFPAMAFDSHGTLYGVRRESGSYRATLCTISLTTGAVTEIGDLGLLQRSLYSGMVFDFRTGKLYWTTRCVTINQHLEETYASHLCELDLTDGHATVLKTFDNSEVFANIFFIDCHPKAPDRASALKFNYSAGSYSEGRLQFAVPSIRYDRSPLTGAVKAEVYINGTLATTLTGLTPGQTATSESITLPDGPCTIEVTCHDSASRKGLPASLDAHGGADVTAPVSDLRVDITERGDRATISWKAPTASAHGGICDLAGVTYRVVRRPDGAVVADGIKATTCTDAPAAHMQLSQYDVYAVTPAGDSEVAHSATVLVGTAWPVTYLETFDSNTRFLTYTTIDIAGNSGPGGNRWMWYPANREAIFWLDYDNFGYVDGWLVTPVIDLKDDQVYRLSWLRRGYSSQVTQESTLSVAVGRKATAEALSRVIHTDTYISGQTSTECHTLFSPDEGDCRIGFHYTSPAADHCGLDNVRVALYGPATIPGAPTALTAVKNGTMATVTATAPATDAKGRTISSLTKITLYRADGSVAATSANPAPGRPVTLSDSRPSDGVNTYIVKAANADGEGLEASVSVNMFPPVPVSVCDMKARVLSDASGASVEWAYPADMLGADGKPLTAADLRYDVYRSFENRTPVLVATDIAATSYTDRDVLASYPDRRQVRMTYSVVAKTDGGSAARVSADAFIGRAYELPLAVDDFYDMPAHPWTSVPVTAWVPRDLAYTPRFTPYTGSSMMVCLAPRTGTATWTSPRLNLSGLADPSLSFMMYGDNSADAALASLAIGIVTEADGVEQPVVMLPGTYSARTDDAGWHKITVDLSAYATATRASIVFAAAGPSGYYIGIDDLLVSGRRLDHDIRVSDFTGPSECVSGRDNIYTAIVNNNGLNAISDARVVFAVDGEEVDSRTVSLAPDASQTIEFTYSPDLNGPERKAVASVTASADRDGNPANDMASLNIDIVSPNVPYVNDLRGTWDAASSAVTLTWSEAATYPRAFPVTDDFESYDNYIIDGIGDWTLVDRDGTATIGGIQGTLGSFSWNNAGKPQAFIVFNPVLTGVGSLCTAHSGSKCLVSFSAAQANDDWLISPQLSGTAQTISLYARAMHPAYLDERFEVLTSRTGTDVDDFEPLTSARVTYDSWRRLTFDLPAGARYFAIRCVSEGQFGLMLDDIEYIPAQPGADLHGYHVYCNGARIAESIGETEYIHDGVRAEDNNVYRVSAQYADGESIHSNEVLIAPAGLPDSATDSVSITAAPGAIVVRGADGLRISVAAADGRLIYHLTGTGHDDLGVAPGMYIVAAGSHTAKLIVK